MTRLIKRKPKTRKIKKRFKSLFQQHPKGFSYIHIGCLYVFQEKNYLLFTIRDGSDLNYAKKCKYGKRMCVPVWVKQELKRRNYLDEFNMLEQIRKYVKEHDNGCDKVASRDVAPKVRKLLRRRKTVRSVGELLQKGEE